MNRGNNIVEISYSIHVVIQIQWIERMQTGCLDLHYDTARIGFLRLFVEGFRGRCKRFRLINQSI